MAGNLIFTLLSLGLAGQILYLLGLSGWLYAWTISFLFLALGLINAGLIKQLFLHIRYATHVQKLLLLILTIQFSLYALGLLVPETGFDALWYHLPEAQVYLSTGIVQKVPELLYSTMPRMGEMYLIPSLLIGLPKIAPFIFTLLFALLTYQLARVFLNRSHSLIATIIVNSCYVIAWISGSAYVDIIRATFELGSFFALLRYFRQKSTIYFFAAAALAGFALSTKIHSFINLIILSLFTLPRLRYPTVRLALLKLGGFIVIAGLVALPWYLDNLLESGHIFYPLNLVSKQADQLQYAGAASYSAWFISRLLRLPLLFWDLTLSPLDFLTPVFLILLPITVWRWRSLAKPLMLYTLLYLVFWWLLPPPETRYIITALPLLSILGLQALTSLPKKYSRLKLIGVILIFISVCTTLSFRLYSSRKYLPLLLGQQTPQRYIDSQTTDFNREIMTKYYSGYWQRYKY